jgi:hypothetical protein
VRLSRICVSRRSSPSLPTSGSSCPLRAACVRSLVNLSRTDSPSAPGAWGCGGNGKSKHKRYVAVTAIHGYRNTIDTGGLGLRRQRERYTQAHTYVAVAVACLQTRHVWLLLLCMVTGLQLTPDAWGCGGQVGVHVAGETLGTMLVMSVDLGALSVKCLGTCCLCTAFSSTDPPATA